MTTIKILSTKVIIIPVSDPFLDEDEYLECCCKNPNGISVTCEERIRWYDGGRHTASELLEIFGITVDEEGRDSAGNKVIIKRVGFPPSGHCGREVTRTIADCLDCCDLVPDIVWDSEKSVEALAPESTGTVYVDGGTPPYFWKIRGYGFSFGTSEYSTKRDARTDVPYINVRAHSMACGNAPISVNDICSSAGGSVKCTVGRWSPIKPGCILPNGETVYTGYGWWENVGTKYWQTSLYTGLIIGGPWEQVTLEQCLGYYSQAIASGKKDCLGIGPVPAGSNLCRVPITEQYREWIC